MSLIMPVDESLCMRLFEPQHAEEVFEVVDANRAHIRQYVPFPDVTNSVEDARDAAEKFVKAFAERKQLVLSVLEHGQVVGGAGWTQWQRSDDADPESSHSADMGYWLIESAVGRGVMTRCVSKLIDVAFDEYKLHRLTIRAEPDNERSNAIPKRLGFTLEGTLRHVCKYDGRWINHNLWSLLAEEREL